MGSDTLNYYRFKVTYITKEKPMTEKTHYIVKRTDVAAQGYDNTTKHRDTLEEAEIAARAIVAKYPGKPLASYTIYKAIEIVRTTQPPVEVIYLEGSF